MRPLTRFFSPASSLENADLLQVINELRGESVPARKDRYHGNSV